MQLVVRILRVLLAVLLFLAVLGGGGLYLLSRHLGSEAFKHQLSTTLEGVVGRSVTFAGPVRVTVYPVLGVQAEDLSLGDPQGFDDQPFATARTLSVSVQLLPLLDRKVDLSTVSVDGLAVRLVRLADGRNNWEGWGPAAGNATAAAPDQDNATASGTQAAALPAILVRGLAVSNATLRIEDRKSGEIVEISGLNLRTGGFVPGQPLAFTLDSSLGWESMDWDARAQLSGRLKTDFSDLSGNLIEEGSLQLDASGGLLPKDNRAVLLADVAFDAQAGNLSLRNFRMKTLGLQLAGSVKGENLYETPRFSGHFEVKPFNPRSFLEQHFPEAAPRHASEALKTASFSTELSGDLDDLTFTGAVLVLDDSVVRGSLNLHDFNKPRYTFDLAVNTLNLDRYAGLWSEKAKPEAKVEGRNGDKAAAEAGFVPLVILKHRLKGSLTVGSFQYAGLQAADCRLEVAGGEGRAQVQILGAKALGGSLAADLAAETPAKVETGAPELHLTGKVQFQDLDMARLPYLPEPRSWSLSGRGSGSASAQLPVKNRIKMPPLKELLAALRGELKLTVRSGVLGLSGKDGLDRYPFNRADAALTLSPAAQQTEEGFAANADLALKVDRDTPRFSADGRVQGPVLLPKTGGVRLKDATLRLALTSAQDKGETIQAELTSRADLDTAAGTLALRSLAVQGMGIGANAGITGTKIFSDDSSFSGKVEFKQTDLKRVARLFGKTPPNTADPNALRRFSGSGEVVYTARAVQLSNLDLNLDGTPFTGRLSVTDFASPRYAFSLQSGSLDLDRYLPPRPPKTEGQPAPSGAEARKAPPEPLPLETLRKLAVDGEAAFKVFKVRGLRFEDVRLVFKAAKGDISLKPVGSGFYGGKLEGGLTLKADTKALTASLALEAKGFDCGPMLNDFIAKEYLRGRTDLSAGLTSFGATDTDLLRHLGGSVRVRVGEGSYRLFGLGSINDEKGRSQDLAASRTNFSNAQAGFAVQDGTFSTTDLSMQGPVVSATGKGRFNVADETIDMLINATLVATPNVPIRVYGNLYDPSFALPPGRLLENTVNDILGIPVKSLKLLKDLVF